MSGHEWIKNDLKNGFEKRFLSDQDEDLFNGKWNVRYSVDTTDVTVGEYNGELKANTIFNAEEQTSLTFTVTATEENIGIWSDYPALRLGFIPINY